MISALLERPSLLDAELQIRTSELHPTSWLTHPAQAPARQWVSAIALDRYHELPSIEIEITPRRPIPKDWKAQAACRDMELTLFFGDEGAARPAMRRSVLRLAKQVCDTCIVSRQCLTEALEKDERGVWGGTSRRQRKVWLAQVDKGERTVGEVVEECLPSRPSSPQDSSPSPRPAG